MDSDYIQQLLVLVKKSYSIEHPMGEDDYRLKDTIENTTSFDPLAHAEDRKTRKNHRVAGS
jgi:RNA polymerase primary sigma factor